MRRHLPYWITQCYLPPDTSERAPPNPSHAGWYWLCLPRRDGRLSWPSWLDSAPAGSRTGDLSITSPTPNHCTTKTTKSFNNGWFAWPLTAGLRQHGLSYRYVIMIYFVFGDGLLQKISCSRGSFESTPNTASLKIWLTSDSKYFYADTRPCM